MIALVSKTVMPVRVPTGQVFAHKLGVFATDSYADQAVLSSSSHQFWAIKYGSTMRTDVDYTPSDVFETFPRPDATEWLERIGRTLDEERREIMLRRDLGLTKLYNLINDPQITDASDPDIARMRAIHVELDEAVMDAYGWSDIPLDHGFHTYRQMQRWTVSPGGAGRDSGSAAGGEPPPGRAGGSQRGEVEAQGPTAQGRVRWRRRRCSRDRHHRASRRGLRRPTS